MYLYFYVYMHMHMYLNVLCCREVLCGQNSVNDGAAPIS